MSAPIPSRPLVKICCIASLDEARTARAAGAAVLGLVSAMPSGPGVIDDALAADIAAAMRGQPVRTFLLTARTSAASIAAQHAEVGSTSLQLVDHVPAAELRELRVRCPGVELVQVIHVTGEGSIAEALAAAPFVDALLLDSGRPHLPTRELGGTGRTHDWRVSRRIRDAVFPLPLWLAGGLTADNAAEAVASVAPHGLDVCNGVRRDGRLAEDRLAAFFSALAT